MPLVVKSRLATCPCTLGEKFARSLTHQAPDAPNPAIVCAGAVITAAAEAAEAWLEVRATVPTQVASRTAAALARARELGGLPIVRMVDTSLIRARINIWLEVRSAARAC